MALGADALQHIKRVLVERRVADGISQPDGIGLFDYAMQQSVPGALPPSQPERKAA